MVEGSIFCILYVLNLSAMYRSSTITLTQSTALWGPPKHTGGRWSFFASIERVSSAVPCAANWTFDKSDNGPQGLGDSNGVNTAAYAELTVK